LVLAPNPKGRKRLFKKEAIHGVGKINVSHSDAGVDTGELSHLSDRAFAKAPTRKGKKTKRKRGFYLKKGTRRKTPLTTKTGRRRVSWGETQRVSIKSSKNPSGVSTGTVLGR